MDCFLFSGQKCRTLVRGNLSSSFSGEAVAFEWNQVSKGEQGVLRQASVCVGSVLRKQWGLKKSSLVSGSASSPLSFDFSLVPSFVKSPV